MTDDQERTRLAAEWARAGGGFAVAPADHAIDVERLVGRTAVAASYSSTHASVSRLEGRGSIVSLDGQGVALSEPVRRWIDLYPSVARRYRARLA